MHMAIVGILLWWYTDGWKQTLRSSGARLRSLLDYFSIDILLRTLFSPFRQIAASGVDGPIGLKLRAFGDRLVSRLVGAVVRTIVMLVGITTILLMFVWSVISAVLWGILPLLPIIGLILMLIGWIPWKIL